MFKKNRVLLLKNWRFYSFEEMKAPPESENKVQWGIIEILRLTLLQAVIGNVEYKGNKV